MRKELAKNYNHRDVEDRLYEKWLEKGYFHTEIDKSKKPFTIVMPPPNITGHLHMGHAFDNTLQDILIRWKRMAGFNALWIPGTDHASISTEVKIVDKMAEEGLTKKQIGREAFMVRAWDWKEKYGNQILLQLRKFGSSCDWERVRFTMDEGLSNAVLEVFLRLYNKGLIYRGEKLINWCPKCLTTISDAEVSHQDSDSKFYHFKYPIKGTNEFLCFATTRPETILADTAIAVNPEDERYTNFVGKTAVVPIVNREIPVVADSYVEKDFGTGVVKITPAHDMNDFEVGVRHNLPRINVMNDNGTMNENAGEYAGLDRFEARKLIVEKFKELGLFVKVEDIKNAVGIHERCSCVVEPLLKKQWFVKMEPLAKPAIEAYKTGKLRFVPERFGKIYLNWLENIHDWCISRQLWWGHRIPGFYCGKCGEVTVSKQMPSNCPKCGYEKLSQDEDSLDTWFSSALWPFSTLGWPDQTEELKHFYPTDVLVTSYDIIFFWVVRMVFSGIEQMGELPFKDVFIHGLIRDSQGRKMSKSLGNGVDPLDFIENFGADALRLTIVTGNSPGNDSRYYPERVEANRNFLNKIWNASRFVLMNLPEDEPKAGINDLTPTDKWILSKVNSLVCDVTENMDNYELGLAVSKIHDFIWDEYCDWYIEMVKPRLYNINDPTRETALWTLKTVLITALKLLHPYMPFITEEIFTSIQSDEESIMVSSWPEYDDSLNFHKEEKEVSIIKELVKGIRAVRTEMNVAPSRKVKVFIVCQNNEIKSIFENSKDFMGLITYGSQFDVQMDKTGIGEDAVPVVIENAVAYMPLADLIDIDKEIERLTREKGNLIKEVERIDKKLSNEGFVNKAPEKVIEEEKEKRTKYNGMLQNVIKQLEQLNK